MDQIDKVALLVGRIEQMQLQAARLEKDLKHLMHDLSLLKKSLSGNESPFGVVYSRYDAE